MSKIVIEAGAIKQQLIEKDPYKDERRVLQILAKYTKLDK